MLLPRLFLAALLTALPAPDRGPQVPIDAAAALHDWDRARARAWAQADPVALRRLYLPSSPAGRTDLAMLRSWRARGLRVADLHMQLLRVRVRSASPDRLVLVVTDRLASGVAVGDRVRVPLPRDGSSTHRLVLRRVDGAWRVAQARPVRTTSSTVRSANR